MKSIKQQYIDLKEGRMSQANFMRNLRMTLPHYVTNVTSYNDAVKILRNKGILSENIIKQLEKGIEVEKEHGGTDLEAAKIALDHLKEDPKYYTKLNKAGLEEEMDDDDAETLAMIDKIAAEKAGEEEVMSQYDESLNEAKSWTNTSGKEMYAQFRELDNLNAQEVLIGIDFEMEENHDLSKEEAAKIVARKLKQNPDFYTAHALAGKEMKEIPTIGKLIPGSDQMRPLKNEADLIDKDNGLKPLKGIEKPKKDSDKGGEKNKAVAGISLMSLVAKTSKGVTKMVATGEKMKVVKESKKSLSEARLNIDGEPNEVVKQAMAFVDSNPTLKALSNEIEFQQSLDPNEALLRFDYWDELPTEALDKLELQFNVEVNKDFDEDTGTLTVYRLTPKFKVSDQTGVAKFLTKESLLDLVREVLSEMESDDEVNTDVDLGLGETFDGRDNVTDVAGHQLDENK